MRYQDWDVLLFPAGEEAAHVPVKEYRTQCYTELRDHTVTPLLTAFIPALPRHAPFQVSIHSWAKTGPLHGKAAKEAWQVKVVIDGACVAAEIFDIDATWPQIMTNDNQARQLRFPPFHRSILAQSSWNAADPIGRIRVELCSGQIDEKYGRFVKESDHVVFAFQPGPADILEQNGISWPNQRMYQYPLSPPSSYGGVPNGISAFPATKHKRVASTNNVLLPAVMGGLATPPLTATFNHPGTYPGMHDINGVYDAGSRSTSAYSTMTDSAAPLLKKDFVPMNFMPTQYPATYPTPQSEALRKAQGQMAIRLPSDQLDMIIKAIQVPHQTQHIGDSAATMPPPPLPHHVTAPTSNGGERRDITFGLMLPSMDERNGTSICNTHHRENSRSDVSMHPSCGSFPSCTTEDAEGRIVHAAAPVPVVRGRKEGSSPTKSTKRKSLSISDAGSPGKGETSSRKSSRLSENEENMDVL